MTGEKQPEPTEEDRETAHFVAQVPGFLNRADAIAQALASQRARLEAAVREECAKIIEREAEMWRNMNPAESRDACLAAQSLAATLRSTGRTEVDLFEQSSFPSVRRGGTEER